MSEEGTSSGEPNQNSDTEGQQIQADDELSQEIKELRKRISMLESQKYDNPDREPDCIKWDLYEQSIGSDPVAFIKSHFEAISTPLEYIKTRKIKDLRPVLRFFPGGTLTVKKSFFLEFLRKFPGYRTKNLKLLEQRLYITRRWLKENGRSGALEDLYQVAQTAR